MTCKQAGCQNRARVRGMCSRCYERERSRLHAYGRWESSYVDAQPVRDHIQALRDAGIGNKRLRELTGVSHNTIQVIMTGRPERGTGPSRKVLRRTADKILGVPVPEVDFQFVAAGRVVRAIGATRRLQALVANGYSQREVCRRLGWTWEGNSTDLFLGRAEHMTAGRARQVAELFSQLQMVPGTNSRARTRARANGWLPPLAWDEDRIDDPTCTPEVVDRPKTAEDVFSDFEYLLSMGVGVEDASRRVGLLPASVKRRYERHGRRCPAALTAVAWQQRKTAS